MTWPPSVSGDLYPQAGEEVQPAARNGRWIGALPSSCDHVNVVVLLALDGEPGANRSAISLHCERCGDTWWEPTGNIKDSPWDESSS